MKVGVLGSGQLGRMLALAGYTLGHRFRFLDNTLGPAAQVAPADDAGFLDDAALRRFAAAVDVITWEFENVPVACAESLALLRPVHPNPRALAVSQDRVVEKEYLRSLGIPTAPFLPVSSSAQVRQALSELGPTAILKTARNGYDGKGQCRVTSPDQVEGAIAQLATGHLILEGVVSFQRELSVIAVRGIDGGIRYYPLAENTHTDGILATSVAPAADLAPGLVSQANEFARRVLEDLNYVGVISIELFQVGDTLVANEIAPRVHNSGHWTMEGCVTSQFENHIRAVTGAPLGDTSPRGHSRLTNIIGKIPDVTNLLSISGAHVHLYDKEERAGRKLGHVTVNAASREVADTLHARVSALVGG